MKKLMIVMTVALAATTLMAAGAKSKKVQPMPGSDDAPVTVGKAAKVRLEQLPRLSKSCLLVAPSIAGGTAIGQCYTKPRNWIVPEVKYTTFGSEKSRFLDQLTFTWHVLLDAKSAPENKGNKEGLVQYSYFSTSVTYYNIPYGSHAASVALPPSYYERYGEPKAIGLTITNENGDELASGSVSEVPGIKSGVRFWEESSIMEAKDKAGQPLVERRQGLLDRSKTIWALVNPNDYETTLR